jgi:GrpB-like predicted nucleotidyltransferase (UPF0157 family)
VAAVTATAGTRHPADEPVEILLRSHDPAWARRYARERDRICAALGDTARRIEHIGSTSVPDLAARPIVDVLVAVEDPSDDAAWLPALEAAGYEVSVRDRGYRVLRTPDHRVHVHVVAAGGNREGGYLAFRDRLRSSARLRREYEALKRELAAHPARTSADAREPFVDRALAS